MSSKTKGLFWLTLAGVFGWVLYKMSGSSFEKMFNNVKTAIMPDGGKK